MYNNNVPSTYFSYFSKIYKMFCVQVSPFTHYLFLVQ